MLMHNREPSRSGHWKVFLAAFLGWMFDGMEMGIFPLVARPALQQMQIASGLVQEGYVQHWMGIVTALFLFGASVGGVVFGWLGDRVGRVRAMTWSILCYSLFTGLCYFASEPWHLAAFRFVAALGMGGEWALGVALLMETWPEGKRPLMAGLIGAAGNLGYVVIGMIAIFFPITRDSWRWVMMVGAGPALLTFFLRLFVPESERWKSAVQNGPSNPLREIFTPPLLRRTCFAILFSAIPLIVTWGTVQWLTLWADQMTGGQMPQAKGYTQIWSAVGAIIGCLIAPLVGERMGRRPVYCALCLLAFAAASVLFRFYHTFDLGFLILVGWVGLFSAAFYGWLPLYLPELFPTRVRATGQGLAFNFGRIFAAIGAWQMGSILHWFDNSYAAAGGAIVMIYFVGAVLIWFAPETRGKPLPE